MADGRLSRGRFTVGAVIVVAMQLLPLPDIHALDGFGALKGPPRANRPGSAAPCVSAPCPDHATAPTAVDPGTLLLAGAALTGLGVWMRRHLAGRLGVGESEPAADAPNVR